MLYVKITIVHYMVKIKLKIMNSKICMLLLALFVLSCNTPNGMKKAPEGWVHLFNGKNLDGWRINENPNSFSVENEMIKVDGPRAHMFYAGDVENHNFKNFEIKVDIMTKPGANSGFYFHTAYQEEGWPKKGYEVQVNNTHTDWRKTSGLYAIDDVKEPPTKDNEWFTMHIIVNGKHIVTKLNGETMVDFTEPEGGNPSNADRRIDSGTFCIQAHDPKSVVYYRNIMVKPLS